MLRGLSLLGLVACPGWLLGQGQPLGADLPRGTRVRVTTIAPAPRVVGSLVAVDGDSVRIVKSHRDTVALPLASVTRLESSAGRRPNYGKGAVIGGGVGLAVGLGLGAVGNGLAEGLCETPSGCGNLGQSLAIGGTVGAGVGAGVGVLLAAVFKGERWQPVTRPGIGTRTIGLRLRF